MSVEREQLGRELAERVDGLLNGAAVVLDPPDRGER